MKKNKNFKSISRNIRKNNNESKMTQKQTAEMIKTEREKFVKIIKDLADSKTEPKKRAEINIDKKVSEYSKRLEAEKLEEERRKKYSKYVSNVLEKQKLEEQDNEITY